MAERRLKVIQMLPALDGGGVERGTLEVGAELVRRGHRSIVISAGGRMVEELVSAGSEHYEWPIGKKSLLTLALIPKLRNWLESESVDIIHARSRLPAWISYLAWRKMPEGKRPRFITTMHGAHSVSRYSRIMTRGETVIAVSEFIRQHIQDNYPQTPMDKVRVIHRGVDPVQFPFGYKPPEVWMADWYIQYPQLKDKLVVTLPGRLTRLKGHHQFIELIGRLRNSGLPVVGLVVGGDDLRRQAYAEEIKAKAGKMGEGAIIFTGQRSDIKEIFAVSDLVLSLSQKPESFGRTVIEALSIGVPVVGLDHGGVSEILSAAFPQGRVALGDAQALFDVVRSLVIDPPEMSVLKHFDLQKMLDATISLYEEEY